MDAHTSAAVAVIRRAAGILLFAACSLAPPISAQQDSAVVSRGDSVRVRLIDVDVRAAVQALAQFLDRPVVFGAVTGGRVTMETPNPIPRAEVLPLLRGLLESQNLELVADSNRLYRVRNREQARPAMEPPASRPNGVPELFVIHLSHARAIDVAATVNALYGRGSALGEPGAAPTLSEQLRQNQVPPAGGAAPPQVVVGAAGRAAVLSGEVTIVPHAGTNSLLVRASRPDFQLIQAAVAELDVRPLQVLIEVLIAEIRRDRTLTFGVGSVQEETRLGRDGTRVSGSVEGPGLGDFVLRVMNVGGGDWSATLRASAARGDATIISRPVILAANNERAVISVGSQRPFVQVSRSLPTETATRDQVVQYKDVGTNLSVRPTISGNGYVTLEVTQEVNAATSETAFDAPVISTRSLQTQLLVRDGQTVILGGLSDRQREESRAGVPVLSSIPLLGGLFGRHSKQTTETELFLFLTPRILSTDEDASAVTEPRMRRSGERTP